MPAFSSWSEVRRTIQHDFILSSLATTFMQFLMAGISLKTGNKVEGFISSQIRLFTCCSIFLGSGTYFLREINPKNPFSILSPLRTIPWLLSCMINTQVTHAIVYAGWGIPPALLIGTITGMVPAALLEGFSLFQHCKRLTEIGRDPAIIDSFNFRS